MSDEVRDPFAVQQRLFPPNAAITVFDVGAYVGDTAVRYAQVFPAATIHAFEPCPQTYQQLLEVATALKCVRPYPLALADEPGRRSFYINDFAPTHSLLPRPRQGRRYFPKDGGTREQIEIQVDTLNGFCETHSIPAIDLLKLDIQGAELLALRGARRLLDDQRIGVIFSEVAFVPHYQDGVLFAELADFLSAQHYRLYDLFTHTHATNGQLRYGDAIFVSDDFRRRVLDVAPEEP